MPVAYPLLRSTFSLITRAYFRQVVVVGLEHVPAHGPVIFAANHPGALVDPLLLMISCPRVVRFAAKEPLFRTWWLGPILRAMQAVALRRKQDTGGSTDNSEAFRALFAALAADGTIGIFPEGISHSGSKLVSLKTGAARLALGASQEHEHLPVVVIPIGINYRSQARFRSQVLVQFGEPIRIEAQHVEQHRRDEVAAVNDLTSRLHEQMTELTINADDWQTLRLLDAVRRFYHPKHAPLSVRVELTQRFLAAYQDIKDHPEVQALAQQVWDYQLRLRELGLRDYQVAAGSQSLPSLVAQAGLSSARFFASLVAGVPGLIVLIPALLAMEAVGRYFHQRETDVAATATMLAGIVFLACTCAAVAAGAWAAGSWPLFFTISSLLPLAIFAAIFLLDRTTSYRRFLIIVKHHVHHRQELKDLVQLREHLVSQITTTVQSLYPDADSLLAGVES